MLAVRDYSSVLASSCRVLFWLEDYVTIQITSTSRDSYGPKNRSAEEVHEDVRCNYFSSARVGQR